MIREYFPAFRSCLFTFLMVCFEVHTFLIFIKSNIYFLFILRTVHVVKKSLPNWPLAYFYSLLLAHRPRHPQPLYILLPQPRHPFYPLLLAYYLESVNAQHKYYHFRKVFLRLLGRLNLITEIKATRNALCSTDMDTGFRSSGVLFHDNLSLSRHFKLLKNVTDLFLLTMISPTPNAILAT